MSFFLQLRITLWKNLTLKKRRPYVTLFELAIPLALFVILLCIRQTPKQQPRKNPRVGFRAQPLPSSGVIPIMQAFCRSHQEDENQLPLFNNSTILEFLENLQHVGQENNFFSPPFTTRDIDGLPDLYRSIIQDPAAVHEVFIRAKGPSYRTLAAVHEVLIRAKDIKVDSVFVNQTMLEEILIQNFSLTTEQVNVLYNSKINFTEVYRILFNSTDSPKDITPVRNKRGLTDFAKSTTNFLPKSDIPAASSIRDNLANVSKNAQNIAGQANNIASGISDQLVNGGLTEQGQNLTDSVKSWFDNNPYKPQLPTNPDVVKEGFQAPESRGDGLIYKIIASDPSLLLDPEVQDVVRQLTGFGGKTGLDPFEVTDVLKKIVLSPVGLQYITCSGDELSRVLIPPTANDTQTLKSIASVMCNMTSDQWADLSHVLLEYSSTQAIVKQLHIEHLNVTSTTIKAAKFVHNLREFIMFEDMIGRLSEFSMNLPQDKCGPINVTDSDEEMPITGSEDFLRDNDTVVVSSMEGLPKRNRTVVSIIEQMKAREKEIEKDEKAEENKSRKEKEPTSQYAGFLQVWMAMQNVLCGETIVSKKNVERYTKTKNPYDLGFSHEEVNQLSVLIQVLYHNPKVLYTPNVTAVDQIIEKANETFALIANVSDYARHWLNVSVDIREYLLEPQTAQDLQDIREMQQDLRSMPAFTAIIQSPEVRSFIENTTVFNATHLLSQLDIIDNAACSWLSLTDGISLNMFKGFKTEEELVHYFQNEAYGDGVTVFARVVFTNIEGVVFTNIEGNDTIPPHVEYKIRQNASLTQKTTMVRERFWFPGPYNWHYFYYTFGFTWIQDVIERAIISVQAGRDVMEPGAWVHEMPYPCYIQDRFLFMIEHVMPLVLVISWVYSVAMLVQSVVYEKEQRLREEDGNSQYMKVMRMMGLQSSVHWLAWSITSFTQASITMFIITLILKYGSILSHSNPVLIFLVLEAYVIATISLSFLMTSFCSKAKVASACAGIFYFISYVPYMYVAITEEAAFVKVPSFAKTLASLFSTTAFGLGAKYFAFYEIEGVGVQWDNINVSPVEGDTYNLLYVIVMMLIDAFIYGMLTWYIENVHPGSFGLPKPWYFPFTYNYWCGHSLRTEATQCSLSDCLPWRKTQGLSVMEEDQACALEDRGDRASFEPEPGHLQVGVQVENLTKVYKNGKLAVKNLSYNFYDGQITSFLGHNGAGKTTTMSILTGMFPPTSGYALIYGNDIRTDMDDIRTSLGMCPQHNVLFDKLTVEEHLWFYSRMKGMDGKSITQEMQQMISDIGLPHKRHHQVDCLSGGMQRKLSVAIAFIAGSRTVILDEPTAGVDVDSRRQIWNLLLKYKKDRTIILSTHHMDEADILGDRIAIISNGQVRCSGSSLFLKSFYGEGYHLIVVKKPSEEDLLSTGTDTLSIDACEPGSSFRTKCQEETVTNFMTKYVSTAYLKSESSWELHYILPFEEAKKGHFEKLFKALDSKLSDLEISSYGIMDTSLEEVFLKVTEKSQTPVEQENERNDKKELLDLNSQQNVAESNIVDIGIDSHQQTGIPLANDDEMNLLYNNDPNIMNQEPILDLDNLVLSGGYQANMAVDNSLDSPLLAGGSLLSGIHNVELSTLPPSGNIGQLSNFNNPLVATGGLPQTLATQSSEPKTIPGRFHKKHKRYPSAGHVTFGSTTETFEISPNKTPSDDSHIGLNSNYTLHGDVKTLIQSGADSSTKRHSRGHYRSPSDISLRTLAAIRGSYQTHRRTGSNVSTGGGFKPSHQRSVSDAREPLLPSPAHHQRLPSDASNVHCDVPSNDHDDVAVDLHGISPNFGTYAKLENQDDHSLLSAEDQVHRSQEGRGSYVLTGFWLILNQFIAIIVKRFFYIKRNRKQLFSQIILPAMFVCIAMTVALTAPQAKDLPPIILSPSMYFNYTQPEGNHIPYMDKGEYNPSQAGDAKAHKIIGTFHMASGVGSTCVLKSPYNSTFDEDILQQINHTSADYRLLAQYFQPQCRNVFVQGLQLRNFVPPPPTPQPTPMPVPNSTESYVTRPHDKYHPNHPEKIVGPYYPQCSCAKDNTGFVCAVGAYSNPPQFKTVTSDVMQDITGNREEEFYLYTTDLYRLHRYGGFTFGINKRDVPDNFGHGGPTEFKKLAVKPSVKIRYNHKGFHSIPTYLNTLNNANLRANLPPEKGNPAAYGITAINHPMAMTNNDFNTDAINQGSDVLIAIFIICAMSFVPASFVVFLVYEKSIKAKHLQCVCGINRVVYWLANYIWDMCNYVIPAMCCILILKGFGIPAYVSAMNFPAVLSLFMLYGWSITPMMYPVSFIFDEPSSAYICMIVANLFIGITCIITSFLLEMFQQNDPGLASIHDILKNIFLLFPNYCLGRGLMDIAFNEYKNQYYYKAGLFDRMNSPFKWDIMARNLVSMATMGFIFFIITLLVEFNFFCKKRCNTSYTWKNSRLLNDDEDVATERKRVLKGAGKRDLLRLENLTKVYSKRNLGKHLAVDRLCLGVPQGECFGLLGVNGAGKTTTFKMLTGDITPTGGDAYLNGHSVLRDLSKVQQSIGYCPQFDALYDELTAREHLQLYARLKGVPYKDQKKVIEWAIERLGLTPYADRQSGTYSGGTKRKLSTAIALIGHPPVILMDEPTTGMDPHSRRFLWDVILDLIKEGRSVILTSHSMEECEALCTRLAIMVNGQFQCLGSIQHLKDRFGDGYTISVRVKGPNYEREVIAMKRFIERHFPEAALKGTHHNTVQYTLPTCSLSLESVFAKMEEAQRDLYVEDYSISQNTLENVFINFAEQQRELSSETESAIGATATNTSQSAASSDSANQNDELDAFVTSNSSDLELDPNEDDFVTFDTHSPAGTRLQLLNLEPTNC